MQNKTRRHAIAAALVVWGVVASAFGYVVRTDDSGIYIVKWGTNSVTMQNKLSASGGLIDGSSPRTSVNAAMDFWNAQVGTVQLLSQSASGSYALGNGTNEIVTDSTAGGEAFASNTLAVTIIYRRGDTCTEADIIFNTAYTWNSYRGPLRAGQEDIQRVGIHELGHVLGLLHPDESGQSVSAIMNSHVSNIDNLTPDDIAGGQKLYGSPGFVPANNNFASATQVVESGGPVAFNGSNIGADREPGEPSHAGAATGHSVWWKWLAPKGGSLTVDTLGSNFDTTLSIYTGSQLSNLVSVASNDDAESTTDNPTSSRKRTSAVTTQVTSGTLYYIAVDGWADSSNPGQGYTGSIVLNLGFAPSEPPQFYAQPVDVTVTEGQEAQFVGRANGIPGPVHSWQRSVAGGAWTDLAESDTYHGTRAEILSVYTTLAMDGDRFRCVATNSAGTATSAEAVLHVKRGVPPTISVQPQSRILIIGYSGGLGVIASGASTYRWYRNNEPVPGATDSSLFLSAATSFDDADYYVVVSNAAGSVVSQTVHVTVLPMGKVVSVQNMGEKTLFLREDGTRWITGVDIWGYGFGNLSSPQPLFRNDEYRVIAAAIGNNHDLALRLDGTLWARGVNDYGQLGDGTTLARYGSGVKVASDVVAIAAAANGSFYIKSDRSLWGMGQNSEGQLGDGTAIDRSTPVKIADGVSSVSANISCTLVVKEDGTLWGMGFNTNGKLGADSVGTRISTPVKLADNVASACAGRLCNFFIKRDGSLWGMGGNIFGTLGDGTNIDRNTPVLIMNDVIAVSSSEQTLIVTRDGTLWGCGSLNTQFGTAALETRNTPVKLASDVASVFAGTSCSFFIKTDGSLWATGDNSYGQLGLEGTFIATPARVTGLDIRTVPTINWSNPSAISAGTALSGTQLNATANIVGSFSYAPAAGTVLSAGTYTLNAIFYPSDSRNYVPASRQVSLTVNPVVSIPSARLANIAARGYCSTGSRVMIGGFVVGGSTTKRVLVRATGPSLAARGINAADVLADPVIEVHRGEPIIATNDNWGDNSNTVELNTVAAQIGAGALDANDTKSSALLLDLQPGAYTFVARGKNDGSGIVLLEVFDADPNGGGSKLVNIATRAYSKPGDGVTIGGFVIVGQARKQVLLRGVGPTLVNFGLSQADVLADPTIELHDASHGNAIIGTNDNWRDNSNAASITTVGARIGASPIDSADAKSSALLLTLDPGAYTFIASGKSNTSGIVLVEIYDAD